MRPTVRHINHDASSSYTGRRPMHKVNSTGPLTPSSSGGVNTALEKSRRASLLAQMKEKTDFVRTAFDDSSIVTTSYQAQAAHSDEDRTRVDDLLKYTRERFEIAEGLLYGENCKTGRKGVEKRKRILKQLSDHLAEIREFTARLNRASAAEGGQAEETKLPDAKKATEEPDTRLNEEKIVEKCIEVVDALTSLCIAIDRPQSTGNSVFEHYFKINEQFPLGAELEDMVIHAALAQTVYLDDLQANVEKCAPLLRKTPAQSWALMEIPDSLRGFFRDVCPNLKRFDDGRFCDPDSGLVMQIFENKETRQATIAFGGTSAGEGKGPLMTRLLSNPWITMRQWRANLSNATGIAITGDMVPDSYNRAASIAGLVNQYVTGKRPGEDWSVSLTGHSKGAAEAAYAALMNELSAVCFGTPELGKQVLETASEEQLDAGLRNIRHYFVQGDLAPAAGDLVAPVLGRRVAHVGSGYWMKPTDDVGSGPLKSVWCHELFLPAAIAEAARQRAPTITS